MPTIFQFSAKLKSRHPRHYPLAYNKITHRYASNYVNPSKWTIQITHTLQAEMEKWKAEAAKINPRPDKPNFEAMLKRKMELLEKVREIEAQLRDHEIGFTVKSAGGSFSEATAKNDYSPEVEVPANGFYTITIRVKNKNGQVTDRSSDFNFRDILIVSLGDSYAAGEGNPDEAGEPTNHMVDYAEQSAAKTLTAIKDDMHIITGVVPNVTPELAFSEWQEPLAHRSYRSGHSMAAEAVQGKYSNFHLASTFLPLARSGAKSDEGLIRYNVGKVYNERRLRLVDKLIGYDKKITEYDRPGSLDLRLQKGQVDEAKEAIRNRQIDFLILTIGGNDIKWSSNFADLLTHDGEWSVFLSIFGKTIEIPASSGESGDDYGRKILLEETNKELLKLPSKFEALAQKIRETLNPRFVLLTEYPNGFFGTTDQNGQTVVKSDCSIFQTPADADIDPKDARLIRELSEKLNEQIRAAAEHNGWILVDGIADEFGKHGVCDKNTYFVSPDKSFKTQGDWYGMFHPNARGHNLYAKRITEKIKATIQANLQIFEPKPRIEIPEVAQEPVKTI